MPQGTLHQKTSAAMKPRGPMWRWACGCRGWSKFRRRPGLDRLRQALVAGDAGRSRRQHAGRRREQLNEILAGTRCCAPIDQMWNANPMREVVPVDWAEIARALRTVWFARWPAPAPACARSTELNAKLWRSAMTTGTRRASAGGAWPAPPRPMRRRRASDKRFAAPEWHEQPGLPDPQGDVPAGLGLAARSRARSRTWTRPSGSA